MLQGHSTLLLFILLALICMSTMVKESDGLASAATETTENLASWNNRWSNDAIGWHLNDVHHGLQKHGGYIIPNFENKKETCDTDMKEGRVRVFVPLCGKTLDMAFLAQHPSISEVVGVDGIRKALEEFSDENPSLEIKPIESKKDGFERLAGKKILLLKGDYFHLNHAESVEKFDAVWDRASIVAIQPKLREDYVGILGVLIKPGGTLLVSTLDRREGTAEAKAAGPPFSVNEAEIRRLYEGLDWVESVTKVGEVDELSENFKASGVTEMYACTFVVQTKK